MKKAAVMVVEFALIWCLLWGTFSAYVFIAGLAVAALVVAAYLRAHRTLPEFKLRWLTLPRFAIYFVKILVQSNLQVARIVLTPGFKERPRIVRFDIAGLTPAQATTLASVISLTPGTLSMDTSDDGSWLFIHCISGADRAEVERTLQEIKQRLMSEVFR